VAQIRYQDWLRQVYQTQTEELPCSDLFDQIALYVERELAGEPVSETMSQVKHTLDVCRDQCRACYDVYVILSKLARLEQAGTMPSLDDIRRML
jgi:hypothetical protein